LRSLTSCDNIRYQPGTPSGALTHNPLSQHMSDCGTFVTLRLAKLGTDRRTDVHACGPVQRPRQEGQERLCPRCLPATAAAIRKTGGWARKTEEGQMGRALSAIAPLRWVE
jgi:hypothetical protein